MTAVRRATGKAHRWIDHVYDEYGAEIQFVTGAFLVAVSVVLVIVAMQVLDHTRLGQQACERAKRYSPYIARDFARRGVMPPDVARAYRDDIPRVCGS